MRSSIFLSRLWRIVTIGSLCLGVVLALLTPMPAAAMPPRPPRSTSPPVAASPERTLIVLSLTLPVETPPQVWQELWTAVQWQDATGAWHDVESWRGALDEMAFGIGKKTWVVEDKDLRTGPFVWLVYSRPGGDLVAVSFPFYLPSTSGDVLESWGRAVLESQPAVETASTFAKPTCVG
jgi:hypothetical protein